MQSCNYSCYCCRENYNNRRKAIYDETLQLVDNLAGDYKGVPYKTLIGAIVEHIYDTSQPRKKKFAQFWVRKKQCSKHYSEVANNFGFANIKLSPRYEQRLLDEIKRLCEVVCLDKVNMANEFYVNYALQNHDPDNISVEWYYNINRFLRANMFTKSLAVCNHDRTIIAIIKGITSKAGYLHADYVYVQTSCDFLQHFTNIKVLIIGNIIMGNVRDYKAIKGEDNCQQYCDLFIHDGKVVHTAGDFIGLTGSESAEEIHARVADYPSVKPSSSAAQ